MKLTFLPVFQLFIAKETIFPSLFSRTLISTTLKFQHRYRQKLILNHNQAPSLIFFIKDYQFIFILLPFKLKVSFNPMSLLRLMLDSHKLRYSMREVIQFFFHFERSSEEKEFLWEELKVFQEAFRSLCT